jgi:hypothetical protein
MGINLLMLHVLCSACFIFFPLSMAACKKEEKWPPAIMDPGKLMHIHMELTLVLVSGVEADTPKKRKQRE